MFARVAMAGVLAALGLLVSVRPAEACGKRSAPVYYHHCCYDPCHHHCGPVYVVSPPPVPLFSKPPTPLPVRVVPFGKGVIVEFTVLTTGTVPPPGMPTGSIHLTKTGGVGEIQYEGYNVRPPAAFGSPVVYSVFLLPTKPGKVEVDVVFALSNGKTETAPLSFDIVPVVYQP